MGDRDSDRFWLSFMKEDQMFGGNSEAPFDVETYEQAKQRDILFNSVLPPGEIRITDPITGGAKGQKLGRFDLIPNEFEAALAEHYGKGARKYEDRNWERGYRWSLSLGALRRHLSAWLGGESLDPETGSNHLIAVVWHAIALYIFELRGLGTDDIRQIKNPAK